MVVHRFEGGGLTISLQTYPLPHQMFNNVVLGSSNEPFEAVIKKVKKDRVRRLLA